MLDYVSQGIVVAITAILSLSICLLFFENNFTYFLYFEIIFLFLFIGLNVIEYYYLSLAILFLAIVIYRSIAPRLKGESE